MAPIKIIVAEDGGDASGSADAQSDASTLLTRLGDGSENLDGHLVPFSFDALLNASQVHGRSFAELFFERDMHLASVAEATFAQALEICVEPTAAIHRDGPNPTFILKLLEWTFSDAPPADIRHGIRGRLIARIRELALAEGNDRWHWMWKVLAAGCGSSRPGPAWDSRGSDRAVETGESPTLLTDRLIPTRIALISQRPEEVVEVAARLTELGYATVILSRSAATSRWDGPVPIVALGGDDRDILPWLGEIDLVVEADAGVIPAWIDATNVIHIKVGEQADSRLARILSALGERGAPARRRVVALIELTSWGGGAETVALHVLRQLDRTRFIPVILTLWDARHHASKVPDIPCVWVDAFVGDHADLPMPSAESPKDQDLRDALYMGMAGHWRAAIGIRNALAALGPDVAVIASMEHAIVATWLAQVGVGGPFISWIHTIESAYLPQIYQDPWMVQWQAWAFASACKAAQVVISPTHYCADDLVSAFGVQPGRVEVVSNPQSCARIRRSSFALDAEADALRADAAFLFVHVGRFSPEKNHDLLVAAAHRLSNRGHDFLLVCIGTGNDQDRILAEIERLGLRGRVRLIGARTNPFPIVARADAMVLSSRLEGFGMVLTEGMACGVPIVSTDCIGGVREVLEGGQSGLLVPSDDPDALADGMSRLMTDAALRSRLVVAGYRRCEDMDVKRVARRWEELIDACHVQEADSEFSASDRVVDRRGGRRDERVSPAKMRIG